MLGRPFHLTRIMALLFFETNDTAVCDYFSGGLIFMVVSLCYSTLQQQQVTYGSFEKCGGDMYIYVCMLVVEQI